MQSKAKALLVIDRRRFISDLKLFQHIYISTLTSTRIRLAGHLEAAIRHLTIDESKRCNCEAFDPADREKFVLLSIKANGE